MFLFEYFLRFSNILLPFQTGSLPDWLLIWVYIRRRCFCIAFTWFLACFRLVPTWFHLITPHNTSIFSTEFAWFLTWFRLVPSNFSHLRKQMFCIGVMRKTNVQRLVTNQHCMSRWCLCMFSTFMHDFPDDHRREP